MFRRIGIIFGIMTLAGSALMADFSYQQTTTITGGALVNMMKVAGVFSKQARQSRDPVHTTVALKGDRMAHRGPNDVTVIDVGKETITTIDLQKKTYSVVTFDEMKQMMEQMSQKMKQGNQGDVTFKVSAKDTGNAKQVAGFDAREMVLRMEMESTGKQSGQQGSMVITSDMWIAPAVPGYAEVRDFSRRMAEKLNWTPGGNMFTNRPDIAQGMAEAYKEIGKLDGMPVLQTMVMGAEGTVPPGDGGQQPAAQSQPQAQPRPQAQPAPERPSVGGALGSALGGRFGLGRKKSQPKQEDQPPAEPAAAPAQAPASAPGSLLKMTTETSGFSAAPVDESQFAVPAGFKKVESDMKRAGQ